MAGQYALARFPTDPVTSKPEGFILPCQPALADRPPSGPGWLHEIKFDGYRVIARKDGDRVRLWARTTSEMTMTSPADRHKNRIGRGDDFNCLSRDSCGSPVPCRVGGGKSHCKTRRCIV